jgi:hypothetical protein
MPEVLTNWRDRLRESIRHKVRSRDPGMSAAQVDTEIDQRFQRLMQMETPSDAELRAMQARGELVSDEALASAYL